VSEVIDNIQKVQVIEDRVSIAVAQKCIEVKKGSK
jgi:hypothetical protein